ncbi:MAG: sigma-70 family RNA polymerase sigma factor, partial [Bacilli bacterium]|nr:sigma-70 family RNA polymerase sigma factor [Bacilli bacterium]
IKEYSNYVFKIVDNAVGNSLSYQDKEEIVSDTFYLLWKNQDRIESNLKAYLATIAKNCSYQKLKKSIDEASAEEKIIGIQDNLDNALYIKEILKKLTPEERNIFNLYYIKGYKVKDISKIINKSVANVKVILYRMRKKLREGKRDV